MDTTGITDTTDGQHRLYYITVDDSGLPDEQLKERPFRLGMNATDNPGDEGGFGKDAPYTTYNYKNSDIQDYKTWADISRSLIGRKYWNVQLGRYL